MICRARIVICLLAYSAVTLGQTWTQQSSGTTQGLHDVSFANALFGWAVGDNGTIRATTDGGGNWAGQVSGTSQPLEGVSFVSESLGWIVGWNGTILHTTNGGANWAPQGSGTNTYLLGVDFVDENNGWAVGVSGTIRHTTNGGANWSPQNSGTLNVLQDVDFVDPSNGWAACGSGQVFHTINGGTTWIAQDVAPTTYLWHIAFVNGDRGIVSGDTTALFLTTNGGETWSARQLGYLGWTGLAFPDTAHAWAVHPTTFHPPIANSIDGGNTWNIVTPNAPINTGFSAVAFPDASHGWAVGSAGIILHYQGASNSPGRNTIEATSFYLHPVYPNPFNSTTQIRFDVPHSASVQLRICDLQGRFVENLASRVFAAGTHTVAYDAAGRATGMYVVRLTSGDYSAAQKVMLVK